MDRSDGVAADHRVRRNGLDPAEHRGVRHERLQRDLHAWRDRAAEVITLCVDRVVGHSSAEVDHHHRTAVLRVGRQSVRDPVGADVLGVVVADSHARLYAGPHHKGLALEVAP